MKEYYIIETIPFDYPIQVQYSESSHFCVWYSGTGKIYKEVNDMEWLVVLLGYLFGRNYHDKKKWNNMTTEQQYQAMWKKTFEVRLTIWD